MEFLDCIIYLALIGVTAFVLGRLIPYSLLRPDSFPFKTAEWERDGNFYNLFRIKKWQNRLPDMSKIFPMLMREKKLGADYKADLPAMISETCIAEFVHVMLCVFGLFCRRILRGAGGRIISFLYILANIPYIMIQRYNRPRLCKLLNEVSRKYAGGYRNVEITGKECHCPL